LHTEEILHHMFYGSPAAGRELLTTRMHVIGVSRVWWTVFLHVVLRVTDRDTDVYGT